MKQFPQLRMRHALKELAPFRPIPEFFLLRPANEEDAEEVAGVLDSAFDEQWTPERALVDLLNNVGVPETYVVEANGQIVGTASYQEKEEPDPAAGWLHYVGVRPEARGFGLGEILSHRVLVEALSRGRTCVYLTTDDFRVSAIRTYLKLGFEPDLWHPSHADRWTTVGKSLE